MRVFLSAGDASGDLHAAALVEALRRRRPGLVVRGLGGEALVKAGMDCVVAQSEFAVAGLVEVAGSLPRLLRAYAKLRHALREERPDVAVLVDSPDLNLPLAAVARRARIPVVYYIAPQVWAWRRGRVRKLARRVDRLAVIFPFEEALFRDAGIATRFVGHPLVDRIDALRRRLRPEVAARDLGLDPERPVLGLLPGSRHNEVALNLPRLLEAATLLQDARPELQLWLGLAPSLVDRPPSVPPGVRVIVGRTLEAMAVSTVLVAAPGTVTVEAALLGVPLVVTHTVNRLSFAIARRITTVPSTCMVNLIAEAGVVPERIQEMARPAAVAALVARLLRDAQAREAMRRDLAAAAARLGSPGAAERAADTVLEVAERD